MKVFLALICCLWSTAVWAQTPTPSPGPQAKQTIRIEVTQVAPKGVLADLAEEHYYGDHRTTYESSGKTIYVEGVFADATEGQKLKIVAYRDGRFTYTDVHGSSHTIEKWTLVKVAE